MQKTLSQRIASFFVARAEKWREQRLFCALSGGADSVALALLMHDLQLPFTALHCNFHLRGEESDADERWVREFCASLGIALEVKHFDVLAQCEKTGESIEMAARTLRYQWFAEQGGYICVAHHADDQAETLLLNLIRGTGLRGLAAMAPERDQIWRPLLDVSRQEILDFLRVRKMRFAEDSTNSDIHYRRNWIRHELLPKLREVNPSISQTLVETARHARQALAVLAVGMQTIAAQVEEQVGEEALLTSDMRRFSLKRLEEYGTAGEMWWRELCVQHGFTTDEAQQAWQGREGLWLASDTHQLCRHGAWLEIAPLQAPTLDFTQEELALPSDFSPSRARWCVTLDADTVEGELQLRRVEEGDRFRPFGMQQGSKLVSDYLTGRRRSRIEKQRALVVCDAVGIVWLVGETIAQRVAVSAETQRVLRLSMKAVEQRNN